MKNLSAAILLLVAVWTAPSQTGRAQTGDQQDAAAAGLVELARSLADKFTPPTAAQIESALDAARRAEAAVDQRLLATGENGAAWRRYLLLDQLAAQLGVASPKGASPESISPERPPNAASPDVAVIGKVLARLDEEYEGLGLPLFIGLRAALERYLAMREAAEPQAREQYAARIADLAAALDDAGSGATPKLLDRIGRDVGWLDKHAQAPQLVAAVREHYLRPNVLLTVSQRVLDGIVEPFTDDSPFVEVILNTPTYGQGLIKGQVKLQFVPHDEGAAIDLSLRAAGDADTVSVKGPVRVYSLGHVRLSGRKRVVFTAEGLDVSGSVVKAESDSETKGIVTTLCGWANRLICRMAWRQLAKNSAAAQAEANVKAEHRLRGRFDEQAAEQMAELRRFYLERVRQPLLARRQFPRRVSLRTTSQRMLMEVVQADRDQLTAAVPPPPLTGQGDIAVRLHESTVNNVARLLAGRTISINRLVEEFEGSADEEDAETSPPEDEIEVTFDDADPLTLRIEDGVLALTVRGKGFTANGRAYPAMNVTVKYRAVLGEGGASLKLAEEPDIIPPRLAGTKGRMSITELAVRRVLKNRLDRDLRREMSAPDLELPAEMFSLRKLPIEQFSADDGWVVFSCRVERPEPSK